MTTRGVVFSRAARQQVLDLYHWIADRSGDEDRAERFAAAVIRFCEGIGDVPFIGVSRDDLRLGLRTVGFRRRVVIAFTVEETTIEILGVFYGGRDYEAHIARHPR